MEGGASLFINLRVSGESGVFGVDPMTLDLTDDGGNHAKLFKQKPVNWLYICSAYRVPALLVNMKNCILTHNGINTEGLFRLAGEQTEIRRFKDLMNKKTFDFNTNDINSIASLLKVHLLYPVNTECQKIDLVSRLASPNP